MERLFFDGAMGTYLRERFGEASAELCCRQNPGAVEAVHRAYIEAGATALKTNSFGEHALEIAPAAWEIACRAARRPAAKRSPSAFSTWARTIFCLKPFRTPPRSRWLGW